MPLSFDDLQYAAGAITNPVVGYLLQDVCERIAAAGKLTATATNQIELMQKLGVNFDVIEAELKRRLRKSHKQLDRLFRDYAAEHYAADYKRLKMSYIPFEDNLALQQIVAAHVKLAQDDLFNATQTKGGRVKLQMVDGGGKPLPWRQFYVNTCDDVNTKVATGAMSYNQAVREASKNLAAKGIQVIPYESGVRTSIEAATRRNAMGYLGLMAEQISLINYDAIGADGWEMSAHARSAIDHEPYQGRQFSEAEWIRLNGKPPKQGDPANKPEVQGILKRRIGTLNCGHTAFPILLGINAPQYTQAQLDKLKQDNADGFTDTNPHGKKIHYTGYEATQQMRYLETQIRNWTRDYVVAVNSQIKDRATIAAARISRYRVEYYRFANSSKLRPQEDRHYAAGYLEARKKAINLGYPVPQVVSRKADSQMPALLEGYREIAPSITVDEP